MILPFLVRIELLLEWWEASGNSEFIEKALEDIE